MHANTFSHIGLARQIKEHSFERAYECVVHGNIREDNGTVNQPIGRHPKDRKKMAVTYRNSKNAVTHFEVFITCNRMTDICHMYSYLMRSACFKPASYVGEITDKPKGMVVHPAVGNYEGTLVNALLYHCGDSREKCSHSSLINLSILVPPFSVGTVKINASRIALLLFQHISGFLLR